MFDFLKQKKNIIVSACNGDFIKQENIHDEMFSKGIIGKAFAIKPIDNNIYSPLDGEVIMIYPTKHAIGIKTNNGIEFLLHIGVDSVKLKGEGFNCLIKENQKVKAGELIMKVDFENLRNKGYFDDVICVFTKVNELKIKNNLTNLNKGEEIGEYK